MPDKNQKFKECIPLNDLSPGNFAIFSVFIYFAMPKCRVLQIGRQFADRKTS